MQVARAWSAGSVEMVGDAAVDASGAICGGKFEISSPTRISLKFVGPLVLLTILGSSAVPRLDAGGPEQTKLSKRLMPIDYVKITLSFLKRSFFL